MRFCTLRIPSKIVFEEGNRVGAEIRGHGADHKQLAFRTVVMKFQGARAMLQCTFLPECERNARATFRGGLGGWVQLKRGIERITRIFELSFCFELERVTL